MITYSVQCVDRWSKKIIFAPNGFGKTLSSQSLENDLRRRGNRPIVFTRRKIEELVNFQNGSFFVGETARESAENQALIEKYEKQNILIQVLQKLFGMVEAEKITSSSYLFSSFRKKSLGSFTTALSLYDKFSKKGASVAYAFDQIILSDSRIKALYLRRIANLIGQIGPRTSNQRLFSDQTLNKLHELENTIQKTLESGKTANIEKSLSDIQNLVDSDRIAEKEAIRRKERSLFSDRIASLYNVLSSTIPHFLLNLFVFEKTAKKTLSYRLFIILLYRAWAKANTSSLANTVIREEVTGGSIETFISVYKRNNEAIKRSEKRIFSKAEFVKKIKNEFDSIVAYNSEVTTEADTKTLSLKVLVKGEAINTPVYNFFSESEIKRLALAVMEVSIQCGIYDSAIFDDPIDSYDDYYLLVACQYIQKTVQHKRLKYWYIFTNNFTASYYFAQILKTKTILYFVDPSLANDPVEQTFCYEATLAEIKQMNVSELALLKDFLERKPETYNRDLAFLAFVLTLRNIKTNIIGEKGFGKLKVTSNDGTKLIANSSFETNVREVIEHCFLHYCPKEDEKQASSESVTVSDLCSLYLQIVEKPGELIKKYEKNEKSAVEFREEVALSPFPSLHEGTPLNIILKKMVQINYLKYEFERRLIETLRSRFAYSRDEIQEIVKTNALGFKIGKAQTIAKNSNPKKNDALVFLESTDQMFKKYSILLNDSDHTITRMFPPYLVTSVRDIKKLFLDIQNIK